MHDPIFWARFDAPALAIVVPLVICQLLLLCIRDGGGATVMLGAVSGTTMAKFATMVATLILRLYLNVLLPPLCAFQLVRTVMTARP